MRLRGLTTTISLLLIFSGCASTVETTSISTSTSPASNLPPGFSDPKICEVLNSGQQEPIVCQQIKATTQSPHIAGQPATVNFSAEGVDLSKITKGGTIWVADAQTVGKLDIKDLPKQGLHKAFQAVPFDPKPHPQDADAATFTYTPNAKNLQEGEKYDRVAVAMLLHEDEAGNLYFYHTDYIDYSVVKTPSDDGDEPDDQDDGGSGGGGVDEPGDTPDGKNGPFADLADDLPPDCDVQKAGPTKVPGVKFPELLSPLPDGSIVTMHDDFVRVDPPGNNNDITIPGRELKNVSLKHGRLVVKTDNALIQNVLIERGTNTYPYLINDNSYRGTRILDSEFVGSNKTGSKMYLGGDCALIDGNIFRQTYRDAMNLDCGCTDPDESKYLTISNNWYKEIGFLPLSQDGHNDAIQSKGKCSKDLNLNGNPDGGLRRVAIKSNYFDFDHYGGTVEPNAAIILQTEDHDDAGEIDRIIVKENLFYKPQGVHGGNSIWLEDKGGLFGLPTNVTITCNQHLGAPLSDPKLLKDYGDAHHYTVKNNIDSFGIPLSVNNP